MGEPERPITSMTCEVFQLVRDAMLDADVYAWDFELDAVASQYTKAILRVIEG